MTQTDKVPSGRRPTLYEYRGGMYSVRQLSEMTDIKLTTIRFRLHRGWDAEMAITEGKVDPCEAGRRGGLVRKPKVVNHERRTKANRAAVETHGVQPETDSVGTVATRTHRGRDHQ